MPDRIAVKVLSPSDLTFFEAFFRKRNTGTNQKSINLNADVFADIFYPDFADDVLGRKIEQPVTVTVFGPSPGKPYKFARSISKGETYKNWRLNGAAVPDPEDEAGRFGGLAKDDVAVMEFHGDVVPSAITMVVLSSVVDKDLVKDLVAETPGGRRSMAETSRARLAEIAAKQSATRSSAARPFA